MKWGQTFDVGIKRIIAPGNLAERMKAPHVVALSKTFDEHGGGPGNVPWVVKRRNGWELVAGRDRFAAMMLRKASGLTVREILEATPEELRDLEDVENLYRRPVPDRDALIAARVAKLAARIKAEPQLPDAVSANPGRPKTPEGKAREQVAAALGSTPEAVRKAQARSEKREEGVAAPSDGARVSAMPPPPIDLHGREMPPQMADVPGLVRQFRAVELAACEVARKAGELSMFGSSNPDDVSVISEAAAALGALVRAKMPSDLCAYCHGLLPACTGCKGRGWLTADAFKAAPAERRGAK